MPCKIDQYVPGTDHHQIIAAGKNGVDRPPSPVRATHEFLASLPAKKRSSCSLSCAWREGHRCPEAAGIGLPKNQRRPSRPRVSDRLALADKLCEPHGTPLVVNRHVGHESASQESCGRAPAWTVLRILQVRHRQRIWPHIPWHCACNNGAQAEEIQISGNGSVTNEEPVSSRKPLAQYPRRSTGSAHPSDLAGVAVSLLFLSRHAHTGYRACPEAVESVAPCPNLLRP